MAKTIDEQRDNVLAQRTAGSAAVQQVGQVGTGLETFFAEFGAQAKAVEKADRDALAQKEAEQTKREAEQTKREAAQRELSRGIQRPTPTIEQSGEIEI